MRTPLDRRRRSTARRWRRLQAIGVGLAAVTGVALRLSGGRVERDGIATVLAGLVLIVAATQLVWIWRPGRPERSR
ncbi:MAG TPA: hypothetical protein VH482_29585 [Thermomicrobiales bacterium]|jgi:hypothetical protein